MMMARLAELAVEERLRRGGVAFRTGPFVVRVSSPAASVAEALRRLYDGFPAAGDEDFVDFHVTIAPPNPLRRIWRRNVVFSFDGHAPFHPVPPDQGPPLLEWGLNWVVANCAHHFVMVHAGVVEHGGRAALLPAPPGSGKSTLCAALAHRGWRLMSDELALISPADGRVAGLARPVSLKNESIAAIRAFAPHAVFSRDVPNTNKGTVALMRAPDDAVARMVEPAVPAWIVMPRFEAGAAARLVPVSKARTCLELADSGFNYSYHGARGFERVAAMVDGCACYRLTYGSLDEAVARFADLAAGTTKAAA